MEAVGDVLVVGAEYKKGCTYKAGSTAVVAVLCRVSLGAVSMGGIGKLR